MHIPPLQGSGICFGLRPQGFALGCHIPPLRGSSPTNVPIRLKGQDDDPTEDFFGLQQR